MATERPTAPPGGTALAKPDQRLADVRGLLERSKDAIRLALPSHIKADYILRVVLTCVQRTPELLECAPVTLLGAVLQAAQLGLVPDGVTGQAYLVPFRNTKKNRKEVQFIPGYRGLVSLARRSGDLSTIGSEVVHDKDTFEYAYGINPVLKHIPSEEDNPGPLRAVYAWAKLRDGGTQIVVMRRREVEAIRARSQARDSQFSPWNSKYPGDVEWMWKKTALKQLTKLLPVSIEIQTAVGLDNRAEINLPQDLGLLTGDEGETLTPDDETIEGQVVDSQPAEPRTPDDEVTLVLNAFTEAERNRVRGLFTRLNLKPVQQLTKVKKYAKAADLLEYLEELAEVLVGTAEDAEKAPRTPPTGTTEAVAYQQQAATKPRSPFRI